MSASRNRLASLLPLAATLVGASCSEGGCVDTPLSPCDPVDPPATPQVSIADVMVTEGDAGGVNAVFTLTLSVASTQTVTVGYATADGTAVAPADYTAATGQVTFSPSQTTRDVSVVVQGDVIDEGASEAFTVALSSPTNSTIGDGSATGTITDDDVAAVPQMSIARTWR